MPVSYLPGLKFLYRLGLSFEVGLFRLPGEDGTPAKPAPAEAGGRNPAESSKFKPDRYTFAKELPE